MIGSKSLTKNVIIPNTSNKKKSFEVLVQMNKNFGICDIILPSNLASPVKPITYTKEDMAEYKTKKTEYDMHIANLKAIRSQLLNEFKGRQFNNQEVRIHLTNVLYEILNK